MCGIAGILTTDVNVDVAAVLARMRQAIHHRGPEDEGDSILALPPGPRLGLTHTRLSIQDLSPAGHQPMTDPASGSWITFNGEIYNHEAIRRQLALGSYRSTGDTETLLRGWVHLGEQVLPLLRGMFAFALYDGGRGELWLVRDRLGIKPLYVAQAGPETWLFASEVRALLASGCVGRQLNRLALDAYLTFGAVPAPWTLLDGVESLLPGEAWRFDLKRADAIPCPERRVYWRPRFVARATPVVSREEAVERLHPVLLEAVRLRMVSDVPVGVFLSGGIDSSCVVAALAAQGHKIQTFSVIFGERGFDESEYSRLVSRHFGTQHTELLLEPRQVLTDFDAAVGAYDQPSIDGLNTYFISRAVRQAGTKVALSGMGGDELFAGYPAFRLLARLEKPLLRRSAWLVSQVLRWLAPRSVQTAKLCALMHRNRSQLSSYVVIRRVMSRSLRRALLSGAEDSLSIPLAPGLAGELSAAVRDLDPVNAHSYLELALYLGNMLLRDLDQMSMAHALEVREPLLDHVLVETAAELHGSLKLAPGRQGRIKGLLVDALKVPLPEQVVRRPKMGFVFPWEKWLRGELKHRIEELLTDGPTLRAVGLAPQAVATLWREFLAGRPGLRYTDVLSLTHLLHWARSHKLAVTPAQLPVAAAGF